MSLKVPESNHLAFNAFTTCLSVVGCQPPEGRDFGCFVL